MKKLDVVVIAAILACALIAFGIIAVLQSDADVVRVYVDNTLYAELPLNKDAELRIETEKGFNLLFVESGRAYIKDADCRDRICINTGKIGELTGSIVCLPHGVVVVIEREEE